MNNFLQSKDTLRERCYKFSLRVITLLDKFPNKRSGWVIGDQLLRSATSIGANLHEAKGASSRLDFKKYFEISLKSAHETKYWLELSRDAELAQKLDIKIILDELAELTKMIASGVLKLKNKTFDF